MEYEEMFSEKNKKLLVIDGYKFCFHKRLAIGVERYKCTKTTCRCFVKLNASKCVVESHTDHNHVKEDSGRLNRQKLSNSLKRKAKECLHEGPTKLIRQELAKGEIGTITERDVRCIRKNIQASRSRKALKLSDTTRELLSEIARSPLGEDVSGIFGQGLPLQQDGGAIVSEPVPSTSTAPCETFVAEDECMEREDLAFIKNEEVILSEDEEKDVAVGFHDYTSTAMTDITDSSTDLKNPLPPLIRQVPEPKTETVTNTAEVCDRRYEAPNTTGCAQDVNELFAKYLVAELRSLHPDDAALLRKKIHCLVADFMIYETGSRAASVQESRVSGSERLS